MGIPVAGSDPAETQATVGDSGAADFANDWEQRGQKITAIGHRTVNFDISATGPFPDSIKQSIFKIAQACTTTGAGLTAAAEAARAQAENDETFQKDYKDTTEVLTKAVAAKQQALVITALGGSPAYMTSAQASETAARAARQAVLDGGVTKTQAALDCLPEHGRQAAAAQQTAYDGLTLRTGYETPTQNSTPTQIAPRVETPNTSGGANPKPSGGTPSKPTDTKPSGKPTENKNEVADTKGGGDPSANKPTGQQSPQGQQPQNQQGAPQGGGQSAPAGGAAPAGGQPQGTKPGGAVPISAPTPVRATDPSKGGGVRPSTPPSQPSSNSPVGKGGVIGSGSGGGTTASPAGSGNQANKAGGGIGSGAGGGSTANNSAGARGGMGGMMSGAGAGGGHGAGGTARPKGEVKADPADKKMRGEDVAEQALGGIVRDGDTGAPVPPPAPGSNGGAPTPPPIPPKP
ncbi:hypothetical protein [Tsukamurella pseudospumae]|uniref:Uncharacterized protein n=1 Tax=Tsukamurella pseudospumae TaxID=239498 RepID=A0A138A8E4_9ACTN|nr:hypothetical protein [Tsukamurella pseudospumae]KXP06735.1 hypothetical protein AXK60_11770 [Tsukamurella pseudospumae]